jgi:predicted RNase H-like nuclease
VATSSPPYSTLAPKKRADVLPYKLVAGVVPCPRGWLVVAVRMMGVTVLPEDCRVVRHLEDLLDQRPAYAAVVVDAPIGLPDEPLPDGYRPCDTDARRLLGWPRRVAVPRVPSRATLGAGSFRRMKEAEPWITDLQERRLRAVAEMDEFVQPYLQRSIYSGNPELSYYLLNGDRPMATNHWTPEGMEERMALVRPRVPDLDRFLDKPPRGATRKHVVDAAGLMWSARRLSGKAVIRLPRDPEWDDNGLRTELVR